MKTRLSGQSGGNLNFHDDSILKPGLMERSFRYLRSLGAGLAAMAAVLILLVSCAQDAQAGNFCNNATRPCRPDEPPKTGEEEQSCYQPPRPSTTCEPLVCGTCTKSPCYVSSGVYTTEASDLTINTVGFPIEVSRLYQSSHVIDGEMGRGWVSSLSARLYYTVIKTPGSPLSDSMEAHVRLLNGTLYRFAENPDGTFTPPAGRFDRLVRNPDSTWDLWLQRSRSRFHFSGTGQLLNTIDDFGNTLVWSYVNDQLRRLSDISGSGRYIAITWGADGRLSDVADHTGRTVHYAYNSGGVLTGVTNPMGQTVHYDYVAGKHAPLLRAVTDHWARNVSTITYDGVDRVASYTEKGETFTYTYRHNNASATTGKSDSSGNTWQYTFGGDGLVTGMVPPGGGSAGQTTYDANGLVALDTDALGVKTRFTHNSDGNVLTATSDYQGAAAVEWRYVYDVDFPDNVTSITPYTPNTNNIHRHWQAKKYDYYPIGSIAPGALHREYEVDDDGVISRVAHTYTYDAHGRQLTDTLANGAVRSVFYDAFGNMEREESPANNPAGVRPITRFTYDPLGRVTTSTDPEGNVTGFAWDALDRLQSRTDPKPSATSKLSFTTTIHYDELESGSLLITRTVDPGGNTTSEAHDAYGQQVRRTDAAGHSFWVTWSNGLQTAAIDANGYVTTFSYDARRRLNRIAYPDGTFEAYTHRADDLISSFRDRAGQLTTYDYDRLKRLTTASYPGGARTTWTYEGQKPVSWTDTRPQSAGTWTRTWNSSFQIETETQGTNGTVAWTYDLLGQTRTETVVGGATTTYGYHDDGSLNAIEWSPVPGSFAHEYDLAGRLTRIRFPNQQTRSYTYDRQGRTVSVANAHPSAGNLAAFTYTHDVDAFSGNNTKLGLLTRIATSFPALSMADAVTKFDYDIRGMLSRADYPAGAPFSGVTAAWTFDAAQNRTSATRNGVTSHYTYQKFGANTLNSSVLLSDGANSYTYNDAGSTISRSGSRGNYSFGWDTGHRIVTVSGSESETHRYDVGTRRISTTTAVGTTANLYSGFHVIRESGSSSAQYLFTAGYDQPLAMLRDGGVYYYAADGLGSVVAMNFQDGTVVNAYAYDAWGVPVAREVTVASPFGFTGRPATAAGLADHRNRSYEAATGSFRSFDPLITWAGRNVAGRAASFVPALSAYAYADGRPTMFVDPLGLQPSSPGPHPGDIANPQQPWANCRKDCQTKRGDDYERCNKARNTALTVCTAQAAGCIWVPPLCGSVAACYGKAAATYAACRGLAEAGYGICVTRCLCLYVPKMYQPAR